MNPDDLLANLRRAGQRYKTALAAETAIDQLVAAVDDARRCGCRGFTIPGGDIARIAVQHSCERRRPSPTRHIDKRWPPAW